MGAPFGNRNAAGSRGGVTHRLRKVVKKGKVNLLRSLQYKGHIVKGSSGYVAKDPTNPHNNYFSESRSGVVKKMMKGIRSDKRHYTRTGKNKKWNGV